MRPMTLFGMEPGRGFEPPWAVLPPPDYKSGALNHYATPALHHIKPIFRLFAFGRTYVLDGIHYRMDSIALSKAPHASVHIFSYTVLQFSGQDIFASSCRINILLFSNLSQKTHSSWKSLLQDCVSAMIPNISHDGRDSRVLS